MPVPDRGRTKAGRWRKKRTDVGKRRLHAEIRHGMRWLFDIEKTAPNINLIA